MLKYIGYVMDIDDARNFAEKRGIEVGPPRPIYDSILGAKLNVWLRETGRSNTRATGIDVKKNGVPVYHILWITRARSGGLKITEYDREEPKDIDVKNWLAAEGFPDLQFTTWLNPTTEPTYMVPKIISPEGGDFPLREHSW